MTKKKITDRCTGACCERLPIPISPHELQASYWAWQRGGEQVRFDGGKNDPIFQDIHLIAPMLVYLGEFDKPPNQYINDTDEVLLNGGKFDHTRHYYRCKHFDPKKKICTIYDMRPAMCRSYPNGNECNYTACTWKEVRAKKETNPQRAKRLRVLQEERDAPKLKGGGGIVEKKTKAKRKAKRKPKRKRLGRGMKDLLGLHEKKKGRKTRSPTT